MSEKFCLKWNDFHTNVSKTFGILRNEDAFYDVTLVSDDQKQVSAHKVVLSASSEYFKTILKQNNHPNPLLCLEGIGSKELNDILNYVYYGEVNIYQEDMDRFLSIADRLKLEGLISSGATLDEEPDHKKEFENDKEDIMFATKDTVLDKLNNSENRTISAEKTKIIIKSADFQNLQELDEKILEHLERDVGRKWKCTICDKILNEKTSARKHVEIHFDGLQFPCQDCNKILRSRHALEMHIHRMHK